MTATTTVTLPCPGCGDDREYEVTYITEIGYFGRAEASLKPIAIHEHKPKGIDPMSLEDWTLCDVETLPGTGIRAMYIRRGRCSDWSGGVQSVLLPDHWRIVRTIPTGPDTVTLGPTEVVVDIDGLSLLRVWQGRNESGWPDYLAGTIRVAKAAQARGLLGGESA